MQKRSLPFAIFKWIAVCMQLISCSNRLGIRSNGSSYLLKKNGQPFERLQLSMQKNNCHLFEWLGLSVQKNCQLFEWLELSVQKKNCFLLEQLRLSVEKNCQPFEQLGLFVRKNWQPFKS